MISPPSLCVCLSLSWSVVGCRCAHVFMAAETWGLIDVSRREVVRSRPEPTPEGVSRAHQRSPIITNTSTNAHTHTHTHSHADTKHEKHNASTLPSPKWCDVIRLDLFTLASLHISCEVISRFLKHNLFFFCLFE